MGRLELRVSDDGVGMPHELREHTIGIEGMRERALSGEWHPVCRVAAAQGHGRHTSPARRRRDA